MPTSSRISSCLGSWSRLTSSDVQPDRIVEALRHYMRDEVFTYPQLAANVKEKLSDPGFHADLGDLVQTTPESYDQVAAADLAMERIGSQLSNAPSLTKIEGGQWRSL